jgi:ubiquinone/menaquinone biosynthesis C-methylase UbiE
MSFPDHFSTVTDSYQRYRPNYPQQLFDIILKNTNNRDSLWDAGCGTGQAIHVLAKHFSRSLGTDPSESQIKKAQASYPGLDFRVQMSEACNLPDKSCSLITAAQAIHWFKLDKFYQQVKRVSQKNGVIAFWCYGLHKLPGHLNEILQFFYQNILGKYWPPQRRLIDEGYESLPKPFQKIEYFPLNMTKEMDLNQYLGYVNTWSAIQSYRLAVNDDDPLALFSESLLGLWGKPEDKQLIDFPLHLYLCRVH